MGIVNASSEERTPHSEVLLINKLSCSLAGKTQTIFLSPASKAAKAYGTETAIEAFRCNYGLNEAYRKTLEGYGLNITGLDGDNNVRLVELSDHPFFIATLFLPQLNSTTEKTHPLIKVMIETMLKQTRQT